MIVKLHQHFQHNKGGEQCGTKRAMFPLRTKPSLPNGKFQGLLIMSRHLYSNTHIEVQGATSGGLYSSI